MNEVLMEENKNHIASPPKSCLAEIWKMTHSFHYEQLFFCGNTSELPVFFGREKLQNKSLASNFVPPAQVKAVFLD